MSVPPDLMALLGGGGAPPAGMGGEGPMPEDLASLFAGAGAPPEEPLPSIVDGEPGGGEDPLIAAIDLIQEAIDAESDQEDVQVMLQCQSKLQGILAKNQKEADGLMQGKAAPGAVRKAAGGLGGGEGY